MSITLNEKTCLSVSRRLRPKERGDLLEKERGDLLSQVVRMHKLELCWTDKKERILAECQAEINRPEFQADYDRRSFRKLGEIVESQREELHCAQAEELQRRDQQLLHGQLLQQNLELREAHPKSLSENGRIKKFQSSTFDTIARRRLVEDQDTILELTGRIQDLQNEISCMSDSKEFQDAESIRSGNSHVTSQPVSVPTSSSSWWNAKPFYRNAEPQRRAAKHLGHTWFFGKRFCKSRCVIISTLSSRIESMEFIDRGAASVIHSGKE